MIRESDYYIGGIFREGLYIQAKELEKRKACSPNAERDFLNFDDELLLNEDPII